MDDTKFHKLADFVLQDFADEIEDASKDMEADYLGGILTITLKDGKQYVINKHGPTKQIWLSSPFSGAHKFSYNEAKESWTGHDKEDLNELLIKEIGVPGRI